MRQMSFLLIIMYLFSFSLCKKNELTNGVRVKTTLPMPGKQGDYTYVNWYDIYHSENLTLYRVTVYVDSSSLNGLDVLVDDIRYRYFVFAKDSLFGINYSTVDRRKGVETSRVSVDSIEKFCFTTFELPTDEKGIKRIPDSVYNNAKNDLVTAYIFKETKEYPEEVVYYFYYSKAFNYVPEIFSKNFDTIKGMKLYRMDVHGNGAYYEKEKFQMPPRTYIYEMERVSANDIDSANIFFEKYKQYMKSNSLQANR